MIYEIIVLFFSILLVITVIGIFTYIIYTRSKLIKLENKINNNNLQKLIDNMNYNYNKLSQQNNELEKIQNPIIDNVNKEIKDITKPIDCEGYWDNSSDNCKYYEVDKSNKRKYIITQSNNFFGEGCSHSEGATTTEGCP